MATKLIYHFDHEGYYTQSQQAELDPLESQLKATDIYLLPAHSTFTEMNLVPVNNKKIKWSGHSWIYENIPPIESEPEPTEQEIIDQLKNTAMQIRKAYLTSTDWYVLREYDQASSYPSNIKNERILAREQINQIEQVNNLTDAQNIEQNHLFAASNNVQ